MFRITNVFIFLFALSSLSLNAQTNYSYSNFTTAQGLPINNIKCVAAGPNGNIWFGSTAGLTKYDGSTMTTYTTTNGLADNTVNRLFVAQNGDILIATNNGLSRFNGTTFTNSLTGTIIRSVFEAQNQEVWVGTSGGGVKRYSTSWATYTTSNGIPHNFVNTITQDLNGNIWVGTSEGAGRFNGTTWTAFTNINGLNIEADQIISSTCDQNGVIWFGSKPSFNIGGGVTSFDGTTWTHYSTPEGLAGKQVEDIVTDSRNRKWFVTFNNGISYFNDDNYPQYTFTTLNNSGGLISNQAQGVAIDPDGYVWFSTISGVSRLSPIKLNSVQVQDAVCATNFEGAITINASGLNSLKYSIDNGNSFVSSNVFSGLTPGVYQVMITDSIFTLSTPDITIETLNPIEPGLPDSLTVCFGDSTQLNAPAQGSNYQWEPAAYFSENEIFNPLFAPTASQFIYLTMEDVNGCEVEDSIYVTVLEQSPMNLTVNGNIFTCTGNFTSYVWTHYDVPIPGAFTNIYAATQPGIYGVYATNSLGCTTYSGMIHYLNANVEDLNSNPEISIITNEHSITIEFTLQNLQNNVLIINVFDITGKKISDLVAVEISQGLYRTELQTEQLQTGIYIINNTELSIHKKIVFLQ